MIGWWLFGAQVVLFAAIQTLNRQERRDIQKKAVLLAERVLVMTPVFDAAVDDHMAAMSVKSAVNAERVVAVQRHSITRANLNAEVATYLKEIGRG